MACCIFVSYSCNVRPSCNLLLMSTQCRRPKFDVNTNQPLQQEVLMLTPSCVAADAALLMAKLLLRRLRAVLSHNNDICPLLVLLLSNNRLRLRARWPSSLSSRCLQVPTLLLLPIGVQYATAVKKLLFSPRLGANFPSDLSINA